MRLPSAINFPLLVRSITRCQSFRWRYSRDSEPRLSRRLYETLKSLTIRIIASQFVSSFLVLLHPIRPFLRICQCEVMLPT